MKLVCRGIICCLPLQDVELDVGVGAGSEEWGEGGSVICDMNRLLYPTIEMDSMQLFKRYSPDTSNFSNDISWNQAFCLTPIIIDGFQPKSKLSRIQPMQLLSILQKQKRS